MSLKDRKSPQFEYDRHNTIENAAAEWHMAQERFQNATSERLIDMAIFDMEAAKRRYMFLLHESEKHVPVKL